MHAVVKLSLRLITDRVDHGRLCCDLAFVQSHDLVAQPRAERRNRRRRAGMGEECLERGGGGDIAGKVPIGCGCAGRLLEATDDLASSGGIAFDGLLHARARMRCLRCLWAVIVDSPHSRKAEAPRAAASQMRSQSILPNRALEDIKSPLPLHMPDSVGIRSKGQARVRSPQLD